MAESEKKSNKLNVVIIILIIVLILLVGIVGYMLLGRDSSEPADDTEQTQVFGAPVLKYDEAAVVLDEQQMFERIQQMQEEVAKGNMALEYKNLAVSKDGVNFACHIANSLANDTDMYFNIYLDNTYEQQILLTGLIPPGQGIGSFESEIPLEPGVYDTVLVFTQVEDDHETIKAQVQVVYQMRVDES